MQLVPSVGFLGHVGSFAIKPDGKRLISPHLAVTQALSACSWPSGETGQYAAARQPDDPVS
jgi:hypothetical protein